MRDVHRVTGRPRARRDETIGARARGEITPSIGRARDATHKVSGRDVVIEKVIRIVPNLG